MPRKKAWTPVQETIDLLITVFEGIGNKVLRI